VIGAIVRSRAARRGLALAVPAAILLLAGAALTPSRANHRPSRFGVVAVAARTSSANPLGVRLSKVYGSDVPARVYGTEIADLEDQGENTRGEMTSELSPLPVRAFAGPVAAYKAYAERWTTIAERDATSLRRALEANGQTSTKTSERGTNETSGQAGAQTNLQEDAETNEQVGAETSGQAGAGTNLRDAETNKRASERISRTSAYTSMRAGAEADWRATWSAYLHLGAVYGLFGSLNQEIDGMPGGLLPGGAPDPHFTGLHRLEMGLWSGVPMRSLAPIADKLARDLQSLRAILPSVQITPLEYATRAHEILEDAQRDLLSGTHVPWSGQGVLGTAAGLDATSEVFHTLAPLLSGRENTEAAVRDELALLSSSIASIRHDHDGWPTLAQLTMPEHELLNGTLAGALAALDLLPGTLETKTSAPVPTLPSPSPAERAKEEAAETAP
jgi:iron uptake system EfeUOB component EfeO/EfeM